MNKWFQTRNTLLSKQLLNVVIKTKQDILINEGFIQSDKIVLKKTESLKQIVGEGVGALKRLLFCTAI